MLEAGAGLAADRRCAIRCLYEGVFGSPPEDEWRGRGGTISQICARLEIPKDSQRHVDQVLRKISSLADMGEYLRTGRRTRFRSPDDSRDLARWTPRVRLKTRNRNTYNHDSEP